MALVCDSQSAEEGDAATAAANVEENDLEDGEIEDDEEEEAGVVVEESESVPPPPAVSIVASIKNDFKDRPPERDRDTGNRDNRSTSSRERERARRHEDVKPKKHMTEAEKSILHLRKRERMQREKWEKARKETVVDNSTDDFASNIEKAIASVLKKDSKQISDEEKEETSLGRGRKRKNRDKDKQNKGKLRKVVDQTSPTRQDDMDENEFLNVRGGSPDVSSIRDERNNDSPRSDDDSYTFSDYSSDERPRNDERRDRKRDVKSKGKGRNKERKFREKGDRKNADQQQQQLNNKDGQRICVFFLQGKCQKNDCPYSHEAAPPMKLELCKFYLMECCAKGDNCSYMHSEFPCKYYHTGLACVHADNCKFAHGPPLNEGLKQILFKHIETAPREILGDFPRMSREEALTMIDGAQRSLQIKYGLAVEPMESDNALNDGSQDETKKIEKPARNRPSRWQDPDPLPAQPPQPPMKPFIYSQDQDMRINSNGDVDMRTLPPPPIAQPIATSTIGDNPTSDVDIRNAPMMTFGEGDVDIRRPDPRVLATKDVDIRQLPGVFDSQVVVPGDSDRSDSNFPVDLPKTQRDLFLRIQAQQKDGTVEETTDAQQEEENNINWYSDDDDEDDDNRLTIGDFNDDFNAPDKDDNSDSVTVTTATSTASAGIMSPPQIRHLDVVEKLGDLSKIDISAEVTKLLSSISQNAKDAMATSAPAICRDPRQAASTSSASAAVLSNDPRSRRRDSTENRKTSVSIYEQGSIDNLDDVRGGRPDVDLRALHLPFKGMMNYTPAKEIDASCNSHPPITWKVHVVDVPRPDYTGLKLNVQDAEKTGDPRLRKIFRLSVDEKDSPASPRASPKQPSTQARIDPRLKKSDEPNLTYNQQLNILQSSAFFQSLTSNQKLLLNQELAARNDQNTTMHDPVLNSMLTNLNLLPPSTMLVPPPPPQVNPNFGAALSILANVSKLNPMLQSTPMINPQIVQPGLLGAAPGIPNMTQEFPINFDPRNGGLLGNAPPPPFVNNNNNGSGGGYQDNNGPFIRHDDDYYGNHQQQQQQQQDFNNHHHHNNSNNNNNSGGNNRDRGFQRDRRRGRNNFPRNNNGGGGGGGGNRNNFRNRNRNRTHSPP